MVGKKFEEILNELKLTPESFGITIGVGKSSIYKLLRGDTKKITKSFAEKINSKFPEYSIPYLLSLNFEGKQVSEFNNEEKLTEEEIKTVSRVLLLKEKQISNVPFFKKWLKEKQLAAKLEVYEMFDTLKKEAEEKQ